MIFIDTLPLNNLPLYIKLVILYYGMDYVNSAYVG